MKTKHTPGPWLVNNDDEMPDGRLVISTDTYRQTKIADVYNPEAEANARLIAAAPELLGVLKDIMEHAQKSIAENPTLKTEMPYIEAKARQAIAKAEGVRP